MSGSEYDFYKGYRPDPKVNDRLKPRKSDFEDKAPYRDILGVLEKEEKHSEDSTMTASEILEAIKKWDDNHRDRLASPPQDTRIIRNRLKKLESNGLVIINRQNGKPNQYWKLPDEEVQSYFWTQITTSLSSLTKWLNRNLTRNEIVSVGFGVYVISGFLVLLHHGLVESPLHNPTDWLNSAGLGGMTAGLSLVVLGHILATIGKNPIYSYD